MKPHCTELICLAIAGMLWPFLGRVDEADQWGPPTTEYRSGNRQYTLSDREPSVRDAAKKAIAHLEQKATGTKPTDPGSKK